VDVDFGEALAGFGECTEYSAPDATGAKARESFLLANAALKRRSSTLLPEFCGATVEELGFKNPSLQSFGIPTFRGGRERWGSHCIWASVLASGFGGQECPPHMCFGPETFGDYRHE
jgi:hypothetical protein